MNSFFRRISLIGSFIVALALSVTLLAGCGSSSDRGSSSGPVDITIWHYYTGSQGEAFESLVSEFNDTLGKDEGIHVTSVSKGSIDDLIGALYESADKGVGADDMPDIYQCYLDMAGDLNNKGLMVDIGQYLTDDEIDTYVSDFMSEGYFAGDGSLKLFPIAKNTEVLMVNATDWNEFAEATGHDVGELVTWEGLSEVAADYYDYSDGRSFFGRDAFPNYILVGSAQLGHDIFNVTDGQMTLDLDKDTFRRLWDCYYVPFVQGHYGQKGRYRSDDIKTGDIIALVCATSSAAYFADEVTLEDGSTYPIDYMVLPLPGFEGSPDYAVLQGASMAVTPSDESKERAAVTFLSWFTDIKRNISFASEAGYLPVQKDACTIEAIESYKESNSLDSNPRLDSIETAIGQIAASKLYTMGVFEKGNAARNTVGFSMIDKAVADREMVLEDPTVLETLLSDEYFEEWFRELSDSLAGFETGK